MLTERRAELLALEYRLERRIAGLRALFFWLLAMFNVMTIAVTLLLTRAIWHLRP